MYLYLLQAILEAQVDKVIACLTQEVGFSRIVIERLDEFEHAQKLSLQVMQKGPNPLPLWARIRVGDLGVFALRRHVRGELQAERRFDRRHEHLHIEHARNIDGHVPRVVPLFVESPEVRSGERFDLLLQTDRQALGDEIVAVKRERKVLYVVALHSS